MNGAPAFNTAKNIARANGAPYGFTLSTTPGKYLPNHIVIYDKFSIKMLENAKTIERLKLAS